MENIYFITPENNKIYNLKLSKNMLDFIEFDFTYFCEQAIILYQKINKKGKLSNEDLSFIRNILIKCNKYYEACVNTKFKDIFLDFAIEYICRTDNITFEDLWERLISSENSFEKDIFQRISLYKSNKAINEWINLLRIQNYAKKKFDFIYDGTACSVAECMARCKYFDLAFNVSAKEIGIKQELLPSSRRFSVSSMPDSVFAISRPAKEIYKQYNEILSDAEIIKNHVVNENTKDFYTMNAFQYISTMERPEPLKMFTAIESFRDLPDYVYEPDSFKALIDLEFQLMLENGIMFLRCTSCGRYFKQSLVYKGTLCNRVKSTGKSCREENEPDIPPQPIPQELSDKCKCISAYLNKNINKVITKKEYDEWISYLTKLKNDITNNTATIEQLDSFLTYSQKMYYK